MESEETLVTVLDRLMPGHHALTALLAGALFLTAASLVWFSRLVSLWRTDRREERESIAVLMGHLVDAQREELKRRVTEGDLLRKQIDVFVAGRWQLQRGLDDLREQLIAARVAMHDYERRLGMPETTFPALPVLPTLIEA